MRRPTFAWKLFFAGALIPLSILTGSGCGGSADSFVFETPVGSGGESQPAQETLFTLESTLDVTPVNAKTVSSTTSAIRIKSLNSAGEVTSSSEPIDIAPTISVRIPNDSAQVKIEYLNESRNAHKIWGLAMPLLGAESEFVVRDTNPDPTVGVVGVTVEGPRSVPVGIPTQFLARATYQDGSTRLVTRSASFFINGRQALVNGVLDPLLSKGVTQGTNLVTASFGDQTSASFPTRVVQSAPTGTPFFSDASGEFRVGELQLEGFGTRAQMRVFSNFDDGIRREVTLAAAYRTSPAGIVDTNGLGQVTGFDAGTTTLEGLLGGRSAVPAQTTVTVLKGFLDTMFGSFRSLPGTLEGMSSVYGLLDLNSDGRTDIVGLPSDGSSEATPDFSKLAIHLGNGDGTFQAPTFVALPYGSPGNGQIRSLTLRNGSVFAVVANDEDSRLAMVSGPTIDKRTRRAIPPSVTLATLPIPPRQLMNLSQDQLLARGQDDSLTWLNFAGAGPAQQVGISYAEIQSGDFVGAQEGFIFHHKVRGRTLEVLRPLVPRNGSSSLATVKTARIDSSRARVTDVLVGPVIPGQDRLGSEDKQPALIAIPGLDEDHNGILISNLLETTDRFAGIIPTTLGGAYARLSPMILESANRRTRSLLMSGGIASELGNQPMAVTVPELHELVARSTTLSGYPFGTFERFETGDVTGDGTSDIITWQSGTLTIIELAAIGTRP